TDGGDQTSLNPEENDGALAVDNLEITFPSAIRDVQVVRGASFRIEKGEILGLVGESGSGKTMTALAVLGLIPFPGYISEGSIRFGDLELVDASESVYRRVRGRRIAMISQEPMVALDPSYTVKAQMVPSIRRFHKVGRAEAIQRALQLL